MIEKTINIILRYHGALIAGILILTAILFFWFIRIEISSNLSGLQPTKGHQDRDYLDYITEDLGSDYVLIVAITDDNIFSVRTLKKIAQLTSRINELSLVDHVLSLSTANLVKGKGDEIYIENMSSSVPTTEEEIEEFRKDVLQNNLYAGNLVSHDGKMTLINVFLQYDYPNKVIMGVVEQIKALVLASFAPERVHFHGNPVVTLAIFKMLVAGLSTFVPYMVIIISVILIINFRNWWCILISFVFIFIALVWTYASMAFLKIPIFILTSLIPPIVAALGISYSIHVFTEYIRQQTTVDDPKTLVARTIRNILLAVWLSATTTAVGFASLSLVNIEAIVQFSMFLTIGVLSLLILVTLFVPSVLIYIGPKWPIKTVASRSLHERPPSRGVRWIVRHRYFIITFSAAIVIPSIFGMKRLDVETDIYKFFKQSAPIIRAEHAIRERFKGTTQISVIVEAEEKGGLEDRSALESIEKLQSFLDGHSSTAKTTSVVDYLKAINKAFHNNKPDYYALPQSQKEISQYLFAHTLADPTRTLDRYLDYDNRIARISVRSALYSSVGILEFKKLIEDQCSKLFPPSISYTVTAEPVLFAFGAQLISRGILFSFGLAASAISIIMFLLFRSFKIGVIAMIPNLLPLIYILALMGWTGIDFNIGTSVIICVAIGIAVDDTIHFLTRYFHELKRTNHYLVRRYTDIRITSDQINTLHVTFNRVRRPIILTSVVVFFGFAVLGFSQFVPIAHFGILTAIIMVFCLICDLILLPALIASVSV